MSAPTPRTDAADRKPEPVSTEITVQLLEGNHTVPVKAFLRYDPKDPYAVVLAFPPSNRTHGEDITWAVSRDLVDAGLKDWSGQGDFRIWPGDTGTVYVKLSSPEGSATFEISKKVLREFLRATYREVPRNKESDQLDMDLVIQRLIA